MEPSFDGVAGVVGARVMATVNADMERAALGALALRDGEDVLVLGFGPGVGLVALLDTVTPGSVLAVDPSAAMLRAARRRLARHPHRARVELSPMRAVDVVAARRFDAAVAVNTVQLWDPHADSLRAVFVALRPGGRFVSLTHEGAITKRAPLERWRARIADDLAAVGFGGPEWTEAAYRSGRACGMRAVKPADDGRAPAR